MLLVLKEEDIQDAIILKNYPFSMELWTLAESVLIRGDKIQIMEEYINDKPEILKTISNLTELEEMKKQYESDLRGLICK